VASTRRWSLQKHRAPHLPRAHSDARRSRSVLVTRRELGRLDPRLSRGGLVSSALCLSLCCDFRLPRAAGRATRCDERRGYSDSVLLPAYVVSALTLDYSLHPVEASLATNGDCQSGAWSVNRGRVRLVYPTPTLRCLYTPGRAQRSLGVLTHEN
jgi:hypothetical protein